MMVSLMVVITLSTAQATGGHAPIVGLYLVTLVAFAAAVACTFASLFIGQQVRYANVIEAEEEDESGGAGGNPARLISPVTGAGIES